MIYNVVGHVVMLVEADSPKEAQRKVNMSLADSGYEVQDDIDGDFLPFESEPGLIPDIP